MVYDEPGDRYIVSFTVEKSEDILYDSGNGLKALKRGADDSTRVIASAIVAVGTEFYDGRNTATIDLERDPDSFAIDAAALESAIESSGIGIADLSVVAPSATETSTGSRSARCATTRRATRTATSFSASILAAPARASSITAARCWSSMTR